MNGYCDFCGVWHSGSCCHPNNMRSHQREYESWLEEKCAAAERALEELRDRLSKHPAYADLTESEEEEVGGDTAEFSYLVRVIDSVLDRYATK